MLVALAAAIRLRSTAASDFSVQVICRVIRTCLLNAFGSLQQTFATGGKESMERAETDLKV